MNSLPLSDPVDEGARIADAAGDADLELKITGGVAVALRCPSALRAPLSRQYADVDAVGHARDGAHISTLLQSLGYEPDDGFNAVNGATRLFFMDRANERQFDVFLDQVDMCHRIDLSKRLGVDPQTIPLADLLLMKLQVIETNSKDYLDILALLVDQSFTSDDAGINLDRLAALTSSDWGLWRTTTMVAKRAGEFAQELDGFEQRSRVHEQVRRYLEAVESSDKTRAWRLRARIGERKRWYELPEEVL